MHSDQLKPKFYLKPITKYVFSEGEQCPLKVNGENWNAPLLDECRSKPSQTSLMGKHDTLNRKNAPVTLLCAPKVISGHARSPAVFLLWLLIDVLKRWKPVRCGHIDDTDPLICNMILSVHIMTLTWGQIFKMAFQGQRIIHSTRLDENTMLPKVMSWLSWVISYYRKNMFSWKRLFFSFCPLEAKPEVKSESNTQKGL